MEGVINSFDIMSGVPMARWKIVLEHDDLELFKFPYYLKADISGHKTDEGAVVRVDDAEDAASKLKKLHKKFPQDKIIVQEGFEGIANALLGGDGK